MDRAARRGRRGWGALGSLLTVALVVGAGAVGLRAAGWDLEDLSQLTRPRAYIEVDGRPAAVPWPETAEGRLLPAVPVTTSGSYAFLHTTEDGTPVGYDPCRPVLYVVRPDGMPPSGQALIDEAVATVSQATGLVLGYAGTTDEPPTVDRPLIQTVRYGDGWAPVLIAWATAAELPELAGEVAGVGGSAAVPGATGEGMWLAGGRVVLDAEDITAVLARSDGYVQARAVLVHELAHVLGLDHVDDTGELMHPSTSTRTELGPGDRQGLALVGQVACQE